MKHVREQYIRNNMVRRFVSVCALVLVGAGFAYGWMVWGLRFGLYTGLAILALGLIVFYNTKGYRKPRHYAPSVLVYHPDAVPFHEQAGNDRLLFCIHGFPSTPGDFHRSWPLVKERGWDMAGPLLPGCGTHPRDLLATSWWDYLEHVKNEYVRLRRQYKKVCLVGSSMGGSLALAVTEEFCKNYELRPSGVATIGSPAVINAWFRHGIVMNPLGYCARMIGWLIPSIGADYEDPNRVGEDGDGNWKGYVGLYPRQAWTLQAGLSAMEKRLPDIDCPVFISHARYDKVVPHRNSLVIAEGVSSEHIHMYIANMDAFNHAHHNLVLYDSQREKVWMAMLDFFEKYSV